MHRTVKILVVISVLGCGVGTSLLFRRTAPTNELPARSTNSAIPLRATPQSGPRPLPFELPVTVENTEPAPIRSVATKVTKSVVRQEPPPLEGVYHPANIEPVVVTIPPDVDQAPERQRTHRIVDGDTLARLAQRYLGDRGRGAEIFAANSDALENPDILPLGKTLKIPARSTAAQPVEASD